MHFLLSSLENAVSLSEACSTRTLFELTWIGETVNSWLLIDPEMFSPWLHYSLWILILSGMSKGQLKPCIYLNNKPSIAHCSNICTPFHNGLAYLNVNPRNEPNPCVEIFVNGFPNSNNFLLVWLQVNTSACPNYVIHEAAVQAVDEDGYPIGRWIVGVGKDILDTYCIIRPDAKTPPILGGLFIGSTYLPSIQERNCFSTPSLLSRFDKSGGRFPSYVLFNQSDRMPFAAHFPTLGMLWHYDGGINKTVGFIAEILGNDATKQSFVSNGLGPFYVRSIQRTALSYTPLPPLPRREPPHFCYEAETTVGYPFAPTFSATTRILIPSTTYLGELSDIFGFKPPSPTTPVSTFPPPPLTTAPPRTAPTRPSVTPRPVIPGIVRSPPPLPNPKAQKEEMSEQARVLAQEKSIYKRCELTKKCVASEVESKSKSMMRPPRGVSGLDPCIRDEECDVLISYGDAEGFEIEDDDVYLEMVGRSNYWVAIGLSQDQLMGEDFVIECVREETNKIEMYTSWNIKFIQQNKRMNRSDPRYKDFIRVHQTGFINGNTFCKFSIRNTVFYVDPDENNKVNTFDLERSVYYILMAVGSGDDRRRIGEGGNLNNHGPLYRFRTGYRVAIGTRFSPKAYQQRLILVHGQFMYVAFLLIFPVSTILGRYYKETFIEISYFGLRQWVLWHIALHILGLVTVFIGHLFLTFANAGWTRLAGNQTDFHFWSSIFSAGFYFFNTFMGLLYYGIKRTGPVVCDGCQWLHAVIGHITYLIALACLARSDRVHYSRLPCFSSSLIAAWVWIYCIFNIIMSYHYCWIDWVRGEDVGQPYAIGPVDIILQPQSDEEVAPGAQIRVYILYAFIAISALFTLTAVVIVVRTDNKSSACYQDEYFLELA